MALKPLRPCRKPGCSVLTRDGYCPAHKSEPKKRGESADWHWVYSTSEWTKRLRPTQLLREPWCRACAKRGFRVRATVVDHIVPHRGDWALFTDQDNLQSLCKRCHDAKTMRELREKLKNNQSKSPGESGRLGAGTRPGAAHARAGKIRRIF